MHFSIVETAPPHLHKRACTLLTPYYYAIKAACGFNRHEEVQEGNLLLGFGAKPHKEVHNTL